MQANQAPFLQELAKAQPWTKDVSASQVQGPRVQTLDSLDSMTQAAEALGMCQQSVTRTRNCREGTAVRGFQCQLQNPKTSGSVAERD